MPAIRHTDHRHLAKRLRYYNRRYGKGRPFAYSQTINPGYELQYGSVVIIICATDIPEAQKNLQRRFKDLLKNGCTQNLINLT